MTVWKYEVPFHSFSVPSIPGLVKVLTVQYQGGIPCLWAEVIPEATPKPHAFQWFGTGQPVPEDAIYCGTLQETPYVWHLYEVRP